MKRSSLPPLNALRAFETSARHMSIKKASEELQVTPSAVSQQVKILETHLALRLFTREANRLALTEQGEKLFSEVTKMFSQLKTIMDGMFRSDADYKNRASSLSISFDNFSENVIA